MDEYDAIHIHIESTPKPRRVLATQAIRPKDADINRVAADIILAIASVRGCTSSNASAILIGRVTIQATPAIVARGCSRYGTNGAKN